MSYLHTLIFSLILHAAIVSFLDKLPEQPKRPVAVEVLYPSESEVKRFVRDIDSANDKEDKRDEKAKLASRRIKRVIEELQAAKIGLTQNASGNPIPPKRQQMKPREQTQGALPSSKILIPPTDPSLNPGAGGLDRYSSISARMIGVKLGGFSALNTDRHLYYTFYSRVNDAVEARWRMSISDLIEGVNQNQLFSKPEWETIVEILIDKDGEFIDAITHRNSGMSAFDTAAVEPFRRAAPFKNPPTGMIASDGQIHMYYRFIINTPYRAQSDVDDFGRPRPRR